MVQMSLHFEEKEGKISCKDDSLLKEGCPNLKCHKMDISLLETDVEKADLEACWWRGNLTEKVEPYKYCSVANTDHVGFHPL